MVTDFIYSLMTDKKNGPLFMPLKIVLSIISLIYAIAIFLRAVCYKVHIFKTHRAPLKVISVGNITLGGTGKTPFVITLAKILEEELKKNVCVLIRGYGWDEQAMLKKNLTDTPVLVGQDRTHSSHKAVKLYGSDTAVLDDGFQHWELGRDLDMVLLDSRNPFGNGRLFPRGILREPKNSLKRADIVVFTKTNKKNIDLDKIADEIKKINKAVVFLEAAHTPVHLYENKTRKIYPLSHLKGRRVMLLSSIGDPAYFEDTVTDLGAEIAEHIKFPDHHNYKSCDIDRIMKRCGERNFDFVVTTEKDIVKLSRLGLYLGQYVILILTVKMDVTSGREILIDRLHSLYTR